MLSNSVWDYFSEKYPYVLWILIAVVLLIPISESILMWEEHPKRLVCEKESDKCNLLTYSYKHSICWGSLLAGRHMYSRCSLPKSVTSEVSVYNLSKIRDVVINADIGYYGVYLVNSDGIKQKIANYKNEEIALRVMNKLKSDIGRWQDPEEYEYAALREQRDYTFHCDL